MTPAALGNTYQDKETGFQGKATQICFSLFSHTLVLLENSQHTRWIEEHRLEPIREKYR